MSENIEVCLNIVVDHLENQEIFLKTEGDCWVENSGLNKQELTNKIVETLNSLYCLETKITNEMERRATERERRNNG